MNENIVSKCPFCMKTEMDYYMHTSNFAAIYNISPIVPGHSLIIPKYHIESLFKLNKNELQEFMELGRRAARLLSNMFQTDSFDWAIQEGELAGQSVAHLHMHVIPRIKNDLPLPGSWYQELQKVNRQDIDTYNRFKLNHQQMTEITNRLKKEAMTTV